MGTSGASLVALVLAFGTGLSVTNVPAFAAALGLVTATGALGLRAAQEVDDPLALYKADAVQIALHRRAHTVRRLDDRSSRSSLW